MKTRDFYRRHLPHYQPPDGWYSVTMRLAGSLPGSAIQRLKAAQKARTLHVAALPDSPGKWSLYWKVQEEYSRDIDMLLHRGLDGPSWLGHDCVASIVAGALKNLDGKSYNLLAFSLMPNHVHVVCGFGSVQLEDFCGVERVDANATMNSLPVTRTFAYVKRYTALRANQSLLRSGPFWQDETYDHLIRSPKELQRTIQYVLENPVKAGLVSLWTEWKWNYCKSGLCFV